MKYGPKKLCKLFQNSHFQMHPSAQTLSLYKNTSVLMVAENEKG